MYDAKNDKRQTKKKQSQWLALAWLAFLICLCATCSSHVAMAATPNQISGLQLWLDASDTSTLKQNSDGTGTVSSDNDPVGYWGDKSGNGNNATQSTPSLQAIYHPLVKNGKSAIRFDGVGDFFNLPSLTYRTVFVVAKSNEATFSNYRGILGYTSLTYILNGWSGTTKMAKGTELIGSVWRDGVSVPWSGAGYEFSPINEYWQGSFVYTAPITQPAWLGKIVESNWMWNGDIAEVIVYNSALSDSDRQAVENYLAIKYFYTVPGAPTIGTATAGYSTASVSFTPPADNGGSVITGYTVTSSPDGRTATGITSPITVTGLTNNTSYTFTVTATNAVGTGSASGPSNSVLVAMQAPGAPTALTDTVGNGQVGLSWLAPVDNGGSAITDYVVEYKLSTEPTVWTVFPDGVSAAASATVTGLTNNLSYDFRVKAVNALGTGPANAIPNATGGTITTSNGYTIHTFTSSGTFVSPDNKNVEVLVAAGGGGGGQVSGGGGAGGLIYYGSESPRTGISYGVTSGSVSVTIGNGGAGGAGYGNSSPSNGGNSSFGSLVAGGGGAGGGWNTIAARNGGSGGGANALSSGADTTVGLGISGQGHDGGSGSLSLGPPSGGGGGGGAGSVGGSSPNVSTAGNGGGGLQYLITGTPVYYSGGGGGGIVAGSGSGGSGGLGGGGNGGASGGNNSGQNGVVNTGGGGGGGVFYDGWGAAGGNGGSGIVIVRYRQIFSATPHIPALPDQVTGLAATGVNQQALLSWTAPFSGGDSVIYDYCVEYKASSDSIWLVFNDGVSTATKATVTGLANGANYDFRVSAINGGGAGVASDIASGTPNAISTLGFVFTGESNSGGIGLNSSATTHELSSRSAVQIMNLTSGNFLFENLQIGVNNLRDHAGLEAYYDTSHGWELQLANSTEANAFPDNPQVHLIKTGQGGTLVSEWNVGGTYWTKFLQRIDAAKTQLPAQRQWVVWLSLGINDAIAGTPISTYKTSLIAHINKIKAELPGAIIVMTEFEAMPGGGGYPATNTALREIAASEANVYSVDTTGMSTDGGNHWDYAGLKQVALSMVNVTNNALGLIYPGMPTGLIADAGAVQVSLAWTAPVANGGSAITDYFIQYKKSSDSGWITLNDGVSTVTAATVSGLDASTSYDFRVTAVNGNGAGNPVVATLTTPPTIASVASDATTGATLHLGQTITFTVTPTVPEAGLTILPTNYNGRALTAWTSHGGGATYTATYTVTAGDPDQAVSLQLLGVTATDVNGTGAATDGADITDTIDATAPTITSVTSTTASGTYGAGQAINLTVNFSENVSSTGNVTVTLNTTPARTCTFSVSNASSDSCTYTVQAGDTVATLGVSGISGTIKDGVLNPMTNFVPATGLAASKTIAIPLYTLTYTAGAGGTISGSSPQTVNYNASSTQVTATPAAHYHFVSWSDSVLTAARTETNVTADHAYTATFAIDTFTLTYSTNSHGTLTGTITQIVNYNASGTEVAAVPDTGYHFVNWSDSVSTASRTDASVTNDITLTATFAIDTHTLTYTAGANGSLTGSSPQTVNYNASGTAVTAVPDTGYHFVNWSDSVSTASRTDASVTNDITVTATFAIDVVSSGGGGGGGPAIIYTPSITIRTPGSGAFYNNGSTVGFDWMPVNGAFTKYKVSYSTDNGTNWTTITDAATSTNLSWIVPNASTMQGKIKVEGYNSSGGLIASVVSTGNFTINGTIPAVNPTPTNPTTNPTTPPPATDATATGAYVPATALANTPDIATDKNLTAPPANTTVYCTASTLIKGSLPAVYYCGADGKRYVFTNDRVYFTWYTDFSTVKIISDTDLAKIPLGDNITYRPGVKMVKAQTDPKVYAVSRGGLLRWISSEAIAKQLYGNDWNKIIDYIPDAFWINYQLGTPII